MTDQNLTHEYPGRLAILFTCTSFHIFPIIIHLWHFNYDQAVSSLV